MILYHILSSYDTENDILYRRRTPTTSHEQNEMTESDFKAWVDCLVQNCLPLDVQRKLLSFEPLTVMEANKYASVLQLVTQAMTLHKQGETNERLDQINKKLSTISSKASTISNKVDLAVWEASAHNPIYKPTDSRSIKGIKELMVTEAVSRLLKDNTVSERSVCENILRRFQSVVGAYDDIDAFRKQVNRELKRRV